jgi:PAS domain S-box-containing protein
MDGKAELYNSRALGAYLEYIERHYPDINKEMVLRYAGINKDDLLNLSHYFSQEQLNSFYEILKVKTGNASLARDLGRFTLSSKAFGLIKTLLFSIISPQLLYELSAKIWSRVARNCSYNITVKKNNVIEVIASPHPTCSEQPFQCEIRIGVLESLVKFSTNKYATVEHDTCIHKGDPHCRYIVTWESTWASTGRRSRIFAAILSCLMASVMLFIMPNLLWGLLSLGVILSAVAVSVFSYRQEKKDMVQAVEAQDAAIKDILELSNTHYGNALLLQELGQATTKYVNTQELCTRVMEVLRTHMEFDRGAILLTDIPGERIEYAAGFGLGKEEEDLIRRSLDRLAEQKDKLMDQVLRDGIPLVVNEIAEIADSMKDVERELLTSLEIGSGICIPLIYGDEMLGVLIVANIREKRLVANTELSLLKGIASHVSVGIMNARAYQQLQESERKYRTIFENTSNASIIIEEDTILLANSAFEKLSGFLRNEIEGKKSWTEFIAPADLEKMKEYHALRMMDASLAPKNYESRFVDRQGSLHDIFLTVGVIPGTNQSIASFMDVTERNRVTREMQERRQFLEGLLTHAPDAIITLNENGAITEWNPGAEKLFGYTREETLGRKVEDLISTEQIRKEVDALTGMFISGEKILPMESVRFRKDGTPVNVVIAGSPIMVSNTRRSYIVVYTDISRYKEIEAALRTSEERYRLLAENVHDVIWLMDLNLNYTYISPSVERLKGFTVEEAMRLSIKDLYTPESYNRVIEVFHEEARNELQKKNTEKHLWRTMELEQYKKDGTTIWTEVTANSIRDETGRPAGILGVTRDISERKRAEKEKKQLESQLFHAQKMEAVGTLAGGIAHDFNNILMGIQGNASLILMDLDSPHPCSERLKSIQQYVKRGSDLTRQLLGFAQGGKYEVKPTDLNDIVGKSAEMFGRTRKDLTVETALQEDLWSVEVDRGQIDQVLMNLFVNAGQAMPDGGRLSIETRNIVLDNASAKTLSLAAGRFAVISVADTGEGIDESIHDRIFDPFFTTKEKGVGTGLGLASAYGIIANHGGKITFESVRNAGTTFHVYIPASRKTPLHEPDTVKGLQMGSETILLVDDEDMILTVGREILEKLGYCVITAKSGADALALYRQNKGDIDLIILDMIMPGLGGRETYESLKKIDPSIKVLLSSGYDMDEHARSILNQGGSGFIQKPFSIQELSTKIREVLSAEPV